MKEIDNMENFKKRTENKNDVLKISFDVLKESTRKAFANRNISPTDDYAGEYADGTKYGAGVNNGEYNVLYSYKTNTIIEKNLIYGTKRIANQIYLVYESNPENLTINYDGTEGAVFRGHMYNDNPMGFMINDKIIVNTSDKKKFRKIITEFFDNACNKEVNYLLTTKLGVDDKLEKSTDSTIVEEQRETKNMNLSSLLTSSEEEISKYFENKIKESKDKTKKKEDCDDKELLFDDKELVEEDDDEEEEGENEIDEITSTATAGAFAYKTPYFLKPGGDLNLGTPEQIKAEKKRKKKYDKYYGKDFYIPVPMNALGWPPLGMEHNFYQGQNYTNENKVVSTNKRKFFSEQENIEQGVNKRYLITEKVSDEDRVNEWKKLSTFNSGETIRRAEDVLSESECKELRECMCAFNNKPDEDDMMDDSNDSLLGGFETVDNEEDDEIVSVEKPDSFIVLRIKKSDLMNESKTFVYDYNSNNFVQNPNKTLSKESLIKESISKDDIEVTSYEVRGNSLVVEMKNHKNKLVNGYNFVSTYDFDKKTNISNNYSSIVESIEKIEEIEGINIKNTIEEYIKNNKHIGLEKK